MSNLVKDIYIVTRSLSSYYDQWRKEVGLLYVRNLRLYDIPIGNSILLKDYWK